MTSPPPYPRTPHLWQPAGSQGRLVVPCDDVSDWLSEPVAVEEKLDGANVCLWLDGTSGKLRVASRGGEGARDRAGQLGRLRAWAAQQQDAFSTLLDGGWVLYGEWLWLRHGVRYDRLPDWLIALDLWHSDHGFAALEERDRRCHAAGLRTPPHVFAGTLASEGRLRGLLGASALSSDHAAEGLIIRRGDGRRAKVVAAGHMPRSDEDWAGKPEHNATLSSLVDTHEP